MLFDWFTVLAQIANFLILMWLLKRFLYKPILASIDTREKHIADILKETELSKQLMDLKQTELTEKNTAFASQRDSLLEKAKLEAASVKQELLDNASHDAAHERSKWITNLQREQGKLYQNISQRAQQEVLLMTRRTLLNLSNVELETQIIQVFVKHLTNLSAQQIQHFSSNIHGEIVIRSAMSLSDDSKDLLKKTLADVFTPQLSLRYEVDEALISGIELVSSGHKLSWNIDDYLSTLKDNIGELLESKLVQDKRQASHKGELSV